MVAWSGDKTTAFAESPLGQHTTPAAVCCVLYFAATCASVFSLVWTRYPAYFALSVSCALRTVAFGVKAAMLENYRPALGGVYLALLNSGLATNLAANSLVLVTWLANTGLHFFGPEQKYVLKWLALLLVAAVLMFGPIVNVVGAGLIYGAYDRYAVTYGERMRDAASYGLAAASAGEIVLDCHICYHVFLWQRKRAGCRPASATQPQRMPRLVAVALLCACLLGVRGAVGVVATYTEHRYAKWWRNDKFFYSFNALPELLVLCLQLPFFMLARIGQAWPKPTGQSKDEEGSEQEHEGQCDTEMSQRP